MRLLITAAALIALPVMALADEEAIEANIKARQGFLEMLSLNMGPLAGMAKGEIPYDEAAATTAAANLELLTKYPFPTLFIEGSSLDDVKGTAAKGDIWKNSEDFAKKYADLGAAVTGAAEAVKGGQGNVGPVVQKIGATCKACHDSYREKN